MPGTSHANRPDARAKAEALFGRLPARGGWLGLPSVMSAEIMGRAGFEFCIIDLEHGPASYETAIAQMIALQAGGTSPVARVPELRGPWIKRALDAGAAAVMAPMIETVEMAEEAVRAFRYGPEGNRGVATRIVRAARYGADPDYLKRWNDQGVLMAQLESPHAVDRAAAIAGVDGIDLLFFGPSDYAASAAFPEAAVIAAALDRVIAAARSNGKLVGAVPFADFSPDDLERRGVDVIGVASDVSILRKGAEAAARRAD